MTDPGDPSFFDSHPATPDRVKNTTKHAKQLTERRGGQSPRPMMRFSLGSTGSSSAKGPPTGLSKDGRTAIRT